jgi:hypothetical protein
MPGANDLLLTLRRLAGVTCSNRTDSLALEDVRGRLDALGKGGAASASLPALAVFSRFLGVGVGRLSKSPPAQAQFLLSLQPLVRGLRGKQRPRSCEYETTSQVPPPTTAQGYAAATLSCAVLVSWTAANRGRPDARIGAVSPA